MSKSLSVSIVIGAALGKRYFSTFDSAQTRAVKLGSAISSTDKKLKTAQGVVRYKTLLAELKEKQRQAGGSSKRLADGIGVVERKYKEAKKAAKGYGLAVGQIIVEQKRLTRESKKLHKQMSRLSKLQTTKDRLAGLKTRALGALGVAYGAGRIIGGAFELEDKKHQLGDVIIGDNREARLQASLAHARQFAAKSLASEAEILEIDYALRSSGLGDEAAKFGSEIVSKVATVTKGSASDVGFIIGDTFTNMGKQMSGTTEEKLNRIGDVLTKTKNLFSIKDFAQLGEGLKEGLSGALANNLSLEQTAALIGQINNGMLKGSQAGTGLNAMLRQLPKASDDIGFDIVRSVDGELDSIATLESLQAALSNIDDIDEKAVLLQKSFGDEGKKALLPLLAGLNDLKKNYRELNENADGTFNEGYQRRMKSASGQWRIFTQNISMVGTTLAGTLLPAINTVITPIAKVMGWVAAGIEKFPVIGWAIGGLAAAFTIYAVGLGIVTAAQWAMNAAMLANPIGLWIAGIVLVVGVIYRYWEPIMGFFSDLWSGIASIFSATWERIKGILSFTPLGMIIKNWGGISSFFTGLWSRIVGQAKAALDWLVGKFEAVAKFIGNTWETVTGWFGGDEKEPGKSPMRKPNIDLKPVALAAALMATPMAIQPDDAVMANLRTASVASATSVQSNDNSTHSYQLTIQQLPGEDQQALAERIMSEIDRRQQQRQREVIGDGI